MNELKRLDNGNEELLSIFSTEKERYGDNILEMPDYLTVLSKSIVDRIPHNKDRNWKQVLDFREISDVPIAISGIINTVASKTLIADFDALDKTIVEGLRTGKYLIGPSKQVNGNYFPMIIKATSKSFVKPITLKQSFNPVGIAMACATISLHESLRSISKEVENISREISYITDLARMDLKSLFLEARNLIIEASIESSEKRNLLLDEADKCLLKGLTKLYLDKSIQIKRLTECVLRSDSDMNEVDKILAYFVEDMQLISRYVGLRVYLNSFRGKLEAVKYVFNEYKHNISEMKDKQIGFGGYTAIELIQEIYPYKSHESDGQDFWIAMPKILLHSINTIEEQLDNKVYVIQG